MSDEVRQEAFAYVDAVVAGAEGARAGGPTGSARPEPSRKSFVARLVPGRAKRTVVHGLIYVMRHPFDHLMHPVRMQLEEEIGQARGIAQAALTRAEQMGAELRRVRTELDRERRGR